jgi:hypothetical protein
MRLPNNIAPTTMIDVIISEAVTPLQPARNARRYAIMSALPHNTLKF